MTGAVLDHLWQSTLVAIGAWLLTLAFRRAGAAVRYGLWFAASAKFLVPFAALAALGRLLAPAIRPPAGATPDPGFIEQATQPFSHAYAAPAADAAAPLTHAAMAAYPAAPAAPAAAGAAHAVMALDPALVLLGVWALGCAAVLITWTVRWTRVRSVARSGTPLPWPAPMPVLAAPSLSEPGLIGLWRPVLVVPQILPDFLEQPEIDALVAHEACHLRRRDNLTAAVHMLVEALFWFHPLVWWIGARLIQERERACDEAVVRAGHDRAAYARSLVECCRFFLQSPLPCVAGASGSNLARRVEMIMTAPPSPPLSWSRKSLLLAAGLCAAASPVAAGWLTSPAGRTAAARATELVSGPAPAPAAPATSAPRASEGAAPITAEQSQPPPAAMAGAEAPARAPAQHVAAPPLASLEASKVSLAPAADVSVSALSLTPVSAQTDAAVPAMAIAPGTAPSSLISDPLWIRLPSVGRSTEVDPRAADSRGAPGRATMRCRADNRGGLWGCSVIDEQPAGLGLGKAAVFLAPEYRLRTFAADGTPVQGRLVDVTVHFTPRLWAKIVDEGKARESSGSPQVAKWLVNPLGYPGASADYYPTQARSVGVSGEVALHCKVKPDGYLSDCTVAHETPEGLGFGRAALLAKPHLLRVESRALDGSPTAGRTVEVRYVFNPPCNVLAENEQRGCTPGRPPEPRH